jgi:ABC-type lipoprotein export system ATPase subunit
MFLQVDRINKSYPSGSSGRRIVLDDLSLKVDDGEAVAIVGPSCYGKTTLLNQIGTMDRPDSGNIYFRGKDIGLLDDKELEQFRNREIGFIFQQHYLLPQCTLLENVLLPTLPLKDKKKKGEAPGRAKELLERVGLWELRNQRPGELSGGECQRTAVVRALINNPSLLLADEPTGALDMDNAQNLSDLLLEINKSERLTLIIVTHSRDLADKLDRSYLLKKGKLEKTS